MGFAIMGMLSRTLKKPPNRVLGLTKSSTYPKIRLESSCRRLRPCWLGFLIIRRIQIVMEFLVLFAKTIVLRPYVFAFLAAFLVSAIALIWLAADLALLAHQLDDRLRL